MSDYNNNQAAGHHYPDVHITISFTDASDGGRRVCARVEEPEAERATQTSPPFDEMKHDYWAI